MTTAASAMAERKALGHYLACRHTAPILKPPEHDLDPIAPFVSVLVVLHAGRSLLSTRNAGAYPFVFNSISEPVGVIATIPKQPIATIPKQPVDLWQAAEQCSRIDIVAYLSSGDETAERPPMAVADSMQLGVHAALRATDQAAIGRRK